jgi:CubicO group peptidase (beta-lactamase class C family)
MMAAVATAEASKPRAPASPTVAASPSPASPAPSPAAPAPSPAASATPAISPGISALPSGRAAAIEAAVLAAMQRLGAPGLSAAVVRERELRWSAGFGLADVENAVPATPATVYRLASVSKPLTATVVLQLVEKGRLDLDAPIQRYVPSFPDKPWPITARELLSHQSGIRNWTEEEFHNTRRFTSLTDALAAFRDDALLFEPGTNTHYTSYGYTLLGAVAESAGGAPFLEQLRAGVLEPAGMESARDDDVLAIIPHRAEGYWRRKDGTLLNAPLTDTSNRLPGGGLVANVEDVARFASALQRGLLLKPETLRLAFTPQTVRGGRVTGYGLGWVLARTGGRREVYHVGGQPQVSTVLYMVPDAGLAVVVLADLEGVENSLLELARQVAAIAS